MHKTTLANLEAALPEEDRPAVEECAERLHRALPKQEQLDRNTVLVAYGGGKDSAYALAFVRAVHLTLAERHGETFRLRVVTMRHAGMPRSVMFNIDRTYRALELYTDPKAELLLVDGNEVRPFERDLPVPPHLVERNRLDVLMSGHRTFGDGRPTFCNACNLSVANSFGAAASYDGGVDLIVTGDSPEEQRAYALWIHRLAHRFGQASTNRQAGFKNTLETLDGLSKVYFDEVHGSENSDRIEQRGVTSDVPSGLTFFSIFDDTSYSSGSHWDLLTNYLGFEFDEFAFNFTESDCGNPALMAHLRGLKTERVYRRTYQEGLAEYVEFALGLMRRKEFPEHLIQRMHDRYYTDTGVESIREAATRYGEETFGLGTGEFVCMIYSPFAGGAASLHDYLVAEQPELAADEDRIRALLSGAEDDPIGQRLEQLSGLTVADLRALHDGPVWSPLGDTSAQTGLLPEVLAGDPHQQTIETSLSPDEGGTRERISGR